jgi:ATP-dependent RNA helicase RhlE
METKRFSNKNRSSYGNSSGRSYARRGGQNSFRGGFRGGRGRTKSLSSYELLRAVEESKKPIIQQVQGSQEAQKHQSFEDFNVTHNLQKNILAKGYTVPTPIQDKTIPIIMENRDLIGIANTGTGKTAAFLIPLIDKVLKDRDNKVLIITPTRELASQIQDEFVSLARNSGVYSALLIGGKNMYAQKKDLYRNPNFVIGTPGRIKDLIRQRALDLSDFNNVVLDEADTMVAIGFINEIRHFIELLPEDRQSLFFSATVSGKVSEIISQFVRNPVTVSVKTGDAAQNIKQEIIHVNGGANKIDLLHELLIKENFEKVLIFGRTKIGVERLGYELVRRGFKADSIHGDKRQSQRIRILGKFKNNEITILLATDVASRGLDIKEVSHVINYELPETYEDYIHRIGRTGRGDKIGTALTFLDSR